MKIDTVSPIPHSMHTDANDFQSAPCGSCTKPSFIAAHENVNTPMNLPATRPMITDRLMPPTRLPSDIVERSMPMLAKANSGMMK